MSREGMSGVDRVSDKIFRARGSVSGMDDEKGGILIR